MGGKLINAPKFQKQWFKWFKWFVASCLVSSGLVSSCRVWSHHVTALVSVWYRPTSPQVVNICETRSFSMKFYSFSCSFMSCLNMCWHACWHQCASVLHKCIHDVYLSFEFGEIRSIDSGQSYLRLRIVSFWIAFLRKSIDFRQS